MFFIEQRPEEVKFEEPEKKHLRRKDQLRNKLVADESGGVAEAECAKQGTCRVLLGFQEDSEQKGCDLNIFFIKITLVWR